MHVRALKQAQMENNIYAIHVISYIGTYKSAAKYGLDRNGLFIQLQLYLNLL